MKRNRLGLWLVKISVLLYGALMLYWLATGVRHYWADLTLPVLATPALWILRPESWLFLRLAFFMQFLYYSFRGVPFLIYGLIAAGRPLPFTGEDRIILLWLFLAGAFLACAVFIHKNRKLFAVEEQEASREPEQVSWKQTVAVLLAFSMPFLPLAEQTAWATLDPRVLDNRVNVNGIRFSPDGQKLGVINQGVSWTIHIWDMKTRTFKPLRAARNEPISSLAFSGDGRYLAMGQMINMGGVNSNTVKNLVDMDLVDLTTGGRRMLQRKEPLSFLLNTTPEVLAVAFSPDNTYLACARGNDDVQIELWNTNTWGLTRTLDTKAVNTDYHPMAYSPDGKYLATEMRKAAIGLWNVATGTLVSTLSEGYGGYIKEIAYSPDGRYLAVAFNKRWSASKAGTEKGFIDIWDTNTGQIFKTIAWDSDSRIGGLSYSPDGKYIAAFLQREDYVRIWDVASGSQAETLRGPVIDSPVVGVAFSPDGKYLAVASEQYIKLYDAQKISQ
ncbi:WD40 repeat domain-containing protein [Methylomusa anaerophila]|uniref:Translocation protein TolB n=1 Tax=Methylomusa anaerophila TaxID=1930071 RepID=A0A348AI92_9FIRM|nr:PD40 domain-containing protein [Methylomusa anaerophila]BBB90790.1 translocation protein TolB [Methylomusa anaerophila]